jgi:hypothetical protein
MYGFNGSAKVRLFVSDVMEGEANKEPVMNVLRMVKLFAWEPKIKQQMLEKREEELKWIKKRQFLQLLNMTLKCIKLQ